MSLAIMSKSKSRPQSQSRAQLQSQSHSPRNRPHDIIVTCRFCGIEYRSGFKHKCDPAKVNIDYRLEYLIDVLGPGSYREIARNIGMDHSYVCRILSGKAPHPTITTIAMISQDTGISIDEIWWFIGAIRKMNRNENEK
jgi:hypothetical protein